MPPSLNKYLYAYQNPTVYVDPDGREALPLFSRPLTEETYQLQPFGMIDTGYEVVDYPLAIGASVLNIPFVVANGMLNAVSLPSRAGAAMTGRTVDEFETEALALTASTGPAAPILQTGALPFRLPSYLHRLNRGRVADAAHVESPRGTAHGQATVVESHRTVSSVREASRRNVGSGYDVPDASEIPDSGFLEHVARERQVLERLDSQFDNSVARSTASGAESAANASRLRGQLAGQEIAGGHAFEKHVLQQGEFRGLGIRSREQFANHIENVINNPTATRQLSGSRAAFWGDDTSTVVIRNPHAADGGTAFQPALGRKYFDEILR